MLWTLLTLALALNQVQKVSDRVGSIFIEGNTDTPAHVILRHVSLMPGQVLDYTEVAAARKRLRALWLFDAADPPVVEVQPDPFDTSFKDIRIRVRERPWNWLLFAVQNTLIGLSTRDGNLFREGVQRVTAKVLSVIP